MRIRLASVFFALLFTVFAAAPFAAPQASPSPAGPDWSLIEKTLGRAPTEQQGAYKVVFWRTDVPVMVGRTRVAPAAALGSWMAFRSTVTGVLSDGDLALLSAEVPAVMDALQQHGFEITALHNHLIGERPEIMYMHFFARGELRSLLDGLKAALSATSTPTMAATAKPPAGAITFDQKTIEEIMGKTGNAVGPVLSFGFPRQDEITAHANRLTPAMGMATAINFQPSPAGVAATGDFVLKETQVTPLLNTLRKGNIVVTALHNHLLDESPRLMFVHFWAEGKAEDVARGLRNALDTIK